MHLNIFQEHSKVRNIKLLEHLTFDSFLGVSINSKYYDKMIQKNKLYLLDIKKGKLEENIFSLHSSRTSE